MSQPIDLSQTPIARWGKLLSDESQKAAAGIPVSVRLGDLQALLKRARGKKKKGKAVVLPELEFGRILPLRQATADQVRDTVRLFNGFGLPAAEVPSIVSGALICASINCTEHEAMEMQAEVVREMARQPQPVGHCIECEIAIFEQHKETMVCSEECFEIWQKEKESAEKFVELVDPIPPSHREAAEVMDKLLKEATPTDKPISPRMARMIETFEMYPGLTLSVKGCLEYVRLYADGVAAKDIQKKLGLEADPYLFVRRSLDRFAASYRQESDEDLRKQMLTLLAEEMSRKGVKE